MSVLLFEQEISLHVHSKLATVSEGIGVVPAAFQNRGSLENPTMLHQCIALCMSVWSSIRREPVTTLVAPA